MMARAVASGGTGPVAIANTALHWRHAGTSGSGYFYPDVNAKLLFETHN